MVADGLAWYEVGLAPVGEVVSALPTAPADLSRALAISPVLQGPGWSARYSATWRRSWPLPSRPLGAAAGAAGVVIGITSVKARRNIAGIGVRTLFAITRDLICQGGFPLAAFPGTTTTLARLFGRSRRHFARIREFRRRFRAIRHGQLAGTDTVRCRAFSGPPAASCPRLSAPAAGRLARPACLAVRPRGHPRGRSGPGGEVADGREYTYTKRGDRRRK